MLNTAALRVSNLIVVGRRYKFSWNHAPLLQVTPDLVKQQTSDNKVWAKSEEAMPLFKSIVGHVPSQQIDSGDMLEYIQNRKPSDAPAITSEPAIRLLSALLTYPLTLAYALSLLFPKHYERENVNVLIVGARAESCLDLPWWKEMLYCNHNVLRHSIRMVGPNMIPCSTICGSVVREVSIKDRHDLHSEPLARTLDITNNLTFNASGGSNVHPDAVKLHEHDDCQELLRWADVFLLYNPGYGNKVLLEAWNPTMQMLLHTRKPIVCTAFGAHDLSRDLQQLDTITREVNQEKHEEPIDFLIPPHENPYKSFKATWDFREEGDSGVIFTNHSLYAVQAK
jgi:hypothetical protein